MRSILPVLLLAGILSSCADRDCVKGEGELEKRELDVAPFSAIVVQGPMDVVLHRGDAQRVEIEAQPNVADLLDTEVRDGQWILRTRQCIRSHKDITVNISVPTLRRIAIEGSGDVSGDAVYTTEQMELEISGSGDMQVAVEAQQVTATIRGSGDLQIEGTCETFQGSIHGSGDIDAMDLKCVRASTEVVGSGDLSIHVTEDLQATVTGSGNITYKGSPTRIDQNVTGSGGISSR